MAKFIDKIKNAGLDKWMHGVACFFICAVVALAVYGIWEDPKPVCGFIGWIAAMCAGLAKELVDFFRGNKFDINDLIADFIGATIGFGLAFLM